MANHAPVVRIPGELDLFLPDLSGAFASSYHGNGDGTFAFITSVIGDEADARLADVNNDGVPDALLVEFDPQRLATSLGSGFGDFRFFDYTALDGADLPVALAIADFDQDGNLDVATGNTDAAIAYALGTGTGAFKSPVYLPTSHRASSPKMLAVDLNNDGFPDIVNASFGNADITVFENSGGAGFGPEKTIDVGYRQQDIATVDLHNDGLLDLIVLERGGNRLGIIYQNDNGSFGSPVDITLPEQPVYLSTGDVNHDGNADLLVSLQSEVHLYLGDSFGSFQFLGDTTVTTVNSPLASLVDIDRDGNLDMVVVEASTGVISTFFGNGDGTFVPPSDYSDVVIGSGSYFNPQFGYLDDLVLSDAAGVVVFSRANGNAITVLDADAAGAAETLTLTAQHGTLTLASLTGITVTAGANGSSSVTLRGSLANLNAALDGLRYVSDAGFVGNDPIGITLDDRGNAGGAALQTTTTFAVFANPIRQIDGTSGDDSLAAHSGRIEGHNGTDTVTFDFKLTDATVSYGADGAVTIDGPGVQAMLTGIEVFRFTDGTVNNDDGDRLVDDLFYYSHNHDVWTAGADADAHYHAIGWKEARDPDAFFSTRTYQAIYADARGTDPLVQYDASGWKEGRIASLAFDTAAFLKANDDVRALGVDPLKVFLGSQGDGSHPAIAATQLLAANGFDYVYYLKNNPDVAAAGVDPFLHFETVGWKEGRNPNALFDTKGYLDTYTDIKAAGINPLDHYNTFGWKEGRDPSVNFDTTDYLAANADISAAHINPLTHYLQNGAYEGRSSHADGLWG